ncbi:hypothetical protein N5S78_01410 [Escherichia coli]|uniref:hypothetical protein n=1 Tax=Escherichia coli TaxID=562 RepID=UPI0022281645|nr:hypothetical protein [Escherichia coli]MCW3413279.1 hypothetical protein [Escherichia coli]MCW7369864.1 hypothetical protein [Escherichia coli]
MALLYIADTKKPPSGGFLVRKKTCVSPRDTALPSLQELKLFLRKKASFFIEMNRA